MRKRGGLGSWRKRPTRRYTQRVVFEDERAARYVSNGVEDKTRTEGGWLTKKIVLRIMGKAGVEKERAGQGLRARLVSCKKEEVQGRISMTRDRGKVKGVRHYPLFG